MENIKSQDVQSFKKAPIVAVLLAGAFVAILNETLLNIALPKIMGSLDITASTAQWLATGYMLTNGIMIPITAFLINRFSTRKLFITAMSVFATGTLIAGISSSFPLLLTARIIQAAGSGIMLPLMMTVFLTIFPIEKRGSAMGMAGLVIIFAPAIGPTLSGWIVEYYSWRVLFFIVLPIAVLDIIFAIIALKNVTKLTYPKIDILSIVLSSFGFGGLLYGFSSAGNSGWGSAEVVTALSVGAVALASFIWRQLILKNPMLEFRVFKYNMFALTTVITMVVMMAMLGAMILLPIYLQTLRGFTPLQSGLLLLPGAILMGIMSPITGKIFDKIGARWLAVIGLAITTITTFQFSNITGSTTYSFLMILYTVRMFGMSLVMMPVMTAGLNQLPQRLNAHGTAMANTMQQVSGSIGTALLVTVMTNQTKDHLQSMTAPKGMSVAAAKQQMADQAMIHGINDAFMVASGIALLALVLSFFIRRTKPHEEDQVAQVPAHENKEAKERKPLTEG